MKPLELVPVGVVHSSYATPGEAPRQGRPAAGIATIEMFGEFEDGLDKIEKYPHLIVLSWFHLAERDRQRVIPPGQSEERGVFAARSPHRPNPLGMCTVDLIERKGNVLIVRGLDAIEGTPVVDIKPFVRELDCIPENPGDGTGAGRG